MRGSAMSKYNPKSIQILAQQVATLFIETLEKGQHVGEIERNYLPILP
jgi:hypothetical protein